MTNVFVSPPPQRRPFADRAAAELGVGCPRAMGLALATADSDGRLTVPTTLS